jgi:hypothetical protein
MKTINKKSIAADPVIVEVRQAKTKLAERYDFNVVAMVESLRNMDAEEKFSCDQASKSESIIRMDKES